MVCLNKCCHFATYPTITFSQNLKFAAQKSVVLKKNISPRREGYISPQGKIYLLTGRYGCRFYFVMTSFPVSVNCSYWIIRDKDSVIFIESKFFFASKMLIFNASELQIRKNGCCQHIISARNSPIVSDACKVE